MFFIVFVIILTYGKCFILLFDTLYFFGGRRHCICCISWESKLPRSLVLLQTIIKGMPAMLRPRRTPFYSLQQNLIRRPNKNKYTERLFHCTSSLSNRYCPHSLFISFTPNTFSITPLSAISSGAELISTLPSDITSTLSEW